MKNKGWYWPFLVVGCLVTSAAFNSMACYVASHHPSLAAVDDYYDDGSAWSEHLEQLQLNKALGWQADIAMSRCAREWEGSQVDVLLRDSSGKPITGAEVEISAFHSARPRQVLVLELEAGEDGHYGVRHPRVRRPGLWQVRLHVRKDADDFRVTTTEVLHP